MLTIPSIRSHARSFPVIYRSFISKPPPWVCRSYQLGPQFIWPFQAPNCWFQFFQHPLQTYPPSPEILGIPWKINLTSLVYVQLHSAAFSSLGMPAFPLGNISTELFAVLPAGFFYCRHKLFPRWYYYCCMSDFSNQFFYSFEWISFVMHTILCRSASIELSYP